jgi:excinuclease UvrABC nuclease subunit
VYAIFSADETLLYVGKSGFIGDRLADHFRKDANGACISPPLYRWSKDPIYVITIAAPEGKKFVASRLEEYLIERLQPCDNTRGIKLRSY